MDALSLLPSIVGAISGISSIVQLAKSNEDIVSKVAAGFPAIAKLLNDYGAKFFPAVAPQIQGAAAAIAVFGQDLVKTAQMTCNIVSPLLGLPNPNLVVDGLAGPHTQAATKALQEKLPGLVADGFWGRKTAAAVQAFLATVGAVKPVATP